MGGNERGTRFEGSVVLVTGAASGMGAAVARQMAAEGARAVVAADVNGEGVEAVAKELTAGRAVSLDVADAAAVDAVVEGVLREHGRLDVVVHAAGVDDPQAKQLIADALVEGRPIEVTDRLDDASWRRVTRINLDGTFHVLRAAVRAMRPVRAGAIVVIGSSSAFDTPVGYPHYAASKAGLIKASESWARELGPLNISVTAIAPGICKTNMLGQFVEHEAAASPEEARIVKSIVPVGRWGTPEDVAEVVTFLTTCKSNYLNAAVIPLDGGMRVGTL